MCEQSKPENSFKRKNTGKKTFFEECHRIMINGSLQETKLFLLDFTTDTLLCQI